jgi:hypothetical protein
MKDEKMAADMKALMANLRKHGVLFYSDDSGKDVETKPKKTEKSSSPNRPIR